jgi:hypothetical protein
MLNNRKKLGNTVFHVKVEPELHEHGAVAEQSQGRRKLREVCTFIFTNQTLLMKKKMILPLLVLLSGLVYGQDLRQFADFYGSRRGSQVMPADSLNHASLRDLYPFTQYTPDRLPALKWYNKLNNKIFEENLIVIKRPAYLFTADPLFDAELGEETVHGTNTWLNTRGFQVYGKIDLKTSPPVSPDLPVITSPATPSPPLAKPASEGAVQRPSFEFYTSYYESQVKFPGYMDSLSEIASGVPGQGRHRLSSGLWDHGYATGWARYKPNALFTFELGTGKNFFGNGYRSMLLSDNARNYPYFRIDTRIWRIHYTNLWAEFQDDHYQDGPQGAYQKKYGAFHYLSYSITSRLELSFFEAVIWQGRDSTHTRGFEINYLNPVIFYRPVEWTMGSPDNALMGTNLSYRLFDRTYLYGQFIVDEFGVDHMKARDGWWANKYGGQIGAKGFIPIGGQKNHATKRFPVLTPHESGIFLQTEFNFTRPYTFSHWTTKQNYGHLSQPLAHPLGANFTEWVSFARLHWNRFTLEGRYSLANFGANFNGQNYGQDIFIPYTSHVSELGNHIGQGLATTLSYKTLTCSYLLNPASLLNLFVTVTNRRQVADGSDNLSLWFTFGIRNSLRNFYYDF